MRTLLLAVAACAAVTAGYILTPGSAADPSPPTAPQDAAPVPPASAARLVAHEWGTFTSFSGSDGVPVGFNPNNTDLPGFMYFQEGDGLTKSNRLQRGGTVSMETPVIYFYTDHDMRVSVKVDFPRGWITEWYPFAAGAPHPKLGKEKLDNTGQGIAWNVKLVPSEPAIFPTEQGENHYYAARETDAVPLQVEAAMPEGPRDHERRGGIVVQRERFLFYRGVGTFAPPLSVRALGGGKIRVTSAAGERISGLVLVTVRGGMVGFRPLGELDAGAQTEATIPEATVSRSELGETLVKSLTAAGLYEKEARAMVKTWDSAWFGEEGSRLLYLVPRSRTDELLPLTIDPKPTEVVRVLVGRHDFLTPEQEALAERQTERIRAAQAELNAAEQELRSLGRFSWEARQAAAKRLEAKGGPR
jgi:hypothetical protein